MATPPQESEMAATSTEKSVNQYEGMFLLPGSAGTDVEAAIKLVRGIIERHEGKVLVIKKWDERKLAYELVKQKRGLFILAYFNAPGSALVAISRDVELSDQVLRVLLTRADYLNQEEMAAVEPQPIQPREERNPWDRPEGMGGGDRGGRPSRDDRPPRDDGRPREDRPPRPRREQFSPADKD
jgi:small subunit ribosomal protein S6